MLIFIIISAINSSDVDIKIYLVSGSNTERTLTNSGGTIRQNPS